MSSTDKHASGSLPPAGPGLAPELIRNQLEKILASAGFARAGRLSRFLRFTVERTLEGRGEELKEYLVGVEVFDRSPDYDQRLDPIVRVEANRLRLKLREYYREEGQGDPVSIDFEKGSYAPIFRASEPRQARRDPKRVALVVALVLFAGSSAAALLIYQQKRVLQQRLLSAAFQSSNQFAPLWGRFWKSGGQHFVIFGSPIFFSIPRQNLFLRETGVNDASDLLLDPRFQEMQKRFGPLEGPRYDYVEIGDAIALQRLTAFFGLAGQTLTPLPAQRANWDSVKEGNIIFLGTPRMNHLLRRLPVKHDFEWGPAPAFDIYNRHPQPGEQLVYSTSSHRDSMTYAVIALFPGLRPDREILVLSAQSSPGTIAGVDYITRPESVQFMTNKLQLAGSGKPKYYQMLLRISVDNSLPVKTEYVTHHLISTTGKP